MKVLITTEFYLPFICGVTTAVLNEKKALEALGHEVRVLTIADVHSPEYKDGVYYVKRNFPSLYKDSYVAVGPTRLMKDIILWKPDVVHSQCEFFTMAYAKRVVRKLGIPLIHTCHTDFDSYGIHFTNNKRLWKHLTHKWIPRFMKSADYVVCPTDKIESLLKSYGVKNEMEIIPVGMDLEHLEQSLDEDERKRIRADYGMKPSDVVFVSVSRLSEEKNIAESIDHFASLLKIRPCIKMLIVGDGSERENLEKKVSEMRLEEVIRFTGQIDMKDVWKYFKAGDIFISSSLSEIQGLTYIEALSAALPIVCRNDDALNMSLTEGVNGYGFDTDKEFIEKVLPLVDNPALRKKMGENAEKSAEKYSLSTFGKKLESIFTRFINEKDKEKHDMQ